jgi:uncharacterized membrane protein
MNTYNRTEPVRLGFGETLELAFENWKKIAMLIGALLILVGIVAIVVYGGLFAMIIGGTDVFEQLTTMQSGEDKVGLTIITLIFSVFMAALFIPLTAGFIQIAHNAQIGEDFSFNTAFEHFKGRHFKELFLSALIINLTTQGISIAGQLLISDPVSGTAIVTNLLVSLISLVITVLTLLTIPFIIFGNLNALEAIKASISVCGQKFFTVLILLIIITICAILGFIGLCIGIFFTLPLVYSLQYAIYRNAVGIDNEDELAEIGQDVV